MLDEMTEIVTYSCGKLFDFWVVSNTANTDWETFFFTTRNIYIFQDERQAAR